MADNQRIIKNLLQWSIDKAKLSEALQGSERLRDRQREIVASTKQIDAVAQSAAKRLTEQARSMDSLQKGTRIATQRYEELAKAAEQAGNAQDKVGSQDTKKFNTGSALSGVAGVVGSVGGSSAAEPLRVLGDIEQVTSAFGTMGPLAGVAAVGVIAVGAAFAKMNSDLEPARQALDGALSAQRAYYDFINGEATTESAQKRIAELKALAADEQAIISENQNAVSGAFKDAQQSYGDLAARLAFAVGDADDKVGESTANAQKNLSAYEGEMKRLEQTLASGGFVAGDMAAKEAELNKSRQAAIPALEALAQQSADLLRREGEQVQEITSERLIRSLRDEQDWAAQRESQLTSHLKNLGSIDTQGQERLAQIREQGNKRLATIDGQLGKLNTQLSSLSANFMKVQRAATQKFYEEEKKADAANKKERLRRLEDLQDDLLSAEESNNVLAFVAAQRAAQKDLRRMSEDADSATQERQRQFEEESRLAEEKHQEDLARVAAEIQAQKDARAQAIIEIQAQAEAETKRIKDATATAQTAFDEQQKRDSDARDLRLKRAAEDEARADLKRQTALQRSLADIDAKAAKEAAAIGIIGTSLNSLIDAVQRGATTAIAKIVSAAASSSLYAPTDPKKGGGASFSAVASAAALKNSIAGGGSGSKIKPTAFGLGGDVKRPTLGLLGERPGYGDLVIPYQKSKGPGSALTQYRGGDVYIGDITIGNGMSKQEVVDAIKSGLRAKMQGEMDARSPA